jgi:uncharacterized protein YndB with AHSA1/START domain
MPTYAVSTTIGARPEEVFAYVADLTRHGEWSADPVQIELVEGDGGPGGRYRSTARSKGKTIAADITVSQREAPMTFAFDVRDLTGDYHHVFTLAPEAGGTRVERRITTSNLSLAQRALFYVVYPTVKRPNARAALGKLKARLESRP